MIMRVVSTTFALVALVLAVAPAGASPRPRDVVASSVAQGRAADGLFDVEALARRTLGPHWRGLPPGEREEFVRLFRDVLRRSFLTVVARSAAEWPTPLDEEVAGNAIIATSSSAELLDRMRTEPSPSEPSARARLAAGLFVVAASQGRRSR